MTHSAPIKQKSINDLIFHRMGCSSDKIQHFCQRWKITELAVFGSILRDDFKPTSDIDFLVKFSPEIKIGIFELYDIEEQLTEMVGRPIDLVFKTSIEKSHNWIRRKNILETAEVIYGTEGGAIPAQEEGGRRKEEGGKRVFLHAFQCM